MAINYRRIEPKDNEALSKVIKSSLERLDLALDGTVYTDEATDFMFDGYQKDGSVYFIAEEDGELLGGSGIAAIPNQTDNYCELQRMFLNESARGKGIGRALMTKCIDFARDFGYDLVYLETFGDMNSARKLYERSGFKYVDESIGNTGHFSCNIYMTLDL